MKEETINGIIGVAKQNIIRDGSLMPVVFLEGRDKKIGMVALPQMENEQMKSRVYDLLGNILKQGLTDSYLLLMDSWMVEGKNPGSKPIESVKPSQHPDRQSAITAYHQNDRGESRIYVIPYKKCEDEVVFGEVRKIDNTMKEESIKGAVSEIWK